MSRYAIAFSLILMNLAACESHPISGEHSAAPPSQAQARVTPEPPEPPEQAPALERAAKPKEARLCAELCAISQALQCEQSAVCMPACQAMLATPSCQSELNVALRCFLEQPRSAWECGENGIASIQHGHCDAEQASYARCVERS